MLLAAGDMLDLTNHDAYLSVFANGDNGFRLLTACLVLYILKDLNVTNHCP